MIGQYLTLYLANINQSFVQKKLSNPKHWQPIFDIMGKKVCSESGEHLYSSIKSFFFIVMASSIHRLVATSNRVFYIKRQMDNVKHKLIKFHVSSLNNLSFYLYSNMI